MKEQRNQGVASTTIKRRIACLSSIFSFYRDLGVIQQNCFKVIEIPPGNQEYHSPILDINQLKQVYSYAEELRKAISHISPTIKMLIFSGLRNEALTNLLVQNINFENALLCINPEAKSVNYKRKMQVIPLPPKFVSELREHTYNYNLKQTDKLLFGLSGLPLADKALNRLTDKISKDLGWMGERRVTPHGYRATISTLLSEQGIDLSSIKFLLGHSDKDNLQFYIRRFGRHIRLLQRELTKIEEMLSDENTYNKVADDPLNIIIEKNLDRNENVLLPRELLLRLIDSDPEIAVKMIQKGYANL